MAVDVARPSSGTVAGGGGGGSGGGGGGTSSKGRIARVIDFYNGIMAEMKKVTWPEVHQVRQATIAIIIFVLVISLVITILDTALNAILVRLIPSLFAGR